MASLEIVNATLKDQKSTDKEGHSNTTSAVQTLNNTMKTFITMMNLQNMKMLEAMREKGKAATKEVAGADAKKPGMSNITKILLALAALAAGFLKGIVDSLKMYAKLFRLDKLMDMIKVGLNTLKTNIAAGFARLLAPIKAFFSTQGGRLMALADDFKMKSVAVFEDAIQGISKAIQPIKNFFSGGGKGTSIGGMIQRVMTFIKNAFMFPLEPLADLIKPFKAIFTGGEDGVSLLTKIINTIKAPFTMASEAASKAVGFIKSAFSIFSEGSGLMKTLGTIGRVIGRLFFPFTLIMTAYDTVVGMIDGFKEDGFLGGLMGGIKGFYKSIVGMPLDLLKSAVSWLLGKFGFDDAEKFLDSFSFSDLIGKMINGLVNSIIEGIAVLVENLPLVPKWVGDKIRAFKLGGGAKGSAAAKDAGGQTGTPEVAPSPKTSPQPTAAEKVIEKKPMVQSTDTGVIESDRSKVPSKSDMAHYREQARLKRAAYDAKMAKKNEAEMAAQGGSDKGKASIVNAPSSTSNVSNNSSSSSAMVSPIATPHDQKDPAMNQSAGSNYAFG